MWYNGFHELRDFDTNIEMHINHAKFNDGKNIIQEDMFVQQNMQLM